MSRPRIMQKVRAACGVKPPAPLPAGYPEAPRFQDPVGVFRRELEAVGGVFLDARERNPAEVLSQVLQQTGHTEVFWEEEKIFIKHGLPYRLRLPESFSTPHLVFSYHYQGRVRLPITLAARSIERDRLAAIPVSASSAAFGIAETGTVVQTVGPGRGRLLNVLPETHIVFLAGGGPPLEPGPALRTGSAGRGGKRAHPGHGSEPDRGHREGAGQGDARSPEMVRDPHGGSRMSRSGAEARCGPAHHRQAPALLLWPPAVGFTTASVRSPTATMESWRSSCPAVGWTIGAWSTISAT